MQGKGIAHAALSVIRLADDFTHEAIIAQDEWDVVHQMMQTKRRENLSGEVQYFAGLVRCADCGSALNVSYDYNRKRYNGFSCWVYKNYGKNRCTSHAIGWVTLNTLVLNDIRRNAAMAAHFKKLYANMLRRAKSESAQNESARLRRELTKAEKRITDLNKILNKLYEDYALERITAERHKSMSEVYSSELSELTERCKQISSELSKSDEIEDNISSFLPIIRKYTDLHELNARILNELIEKIVVHEKEKAEDGTVTQQVDIYYKFIGLTISEKADINMLG